MKYIDTSVIIAAFDSLDQRRDVARRIIEDEEEKIISEITLLELASVLSRRDLKEEILKELNLEERLIIPTLLIYLLRKFNFKYEGLDGNITMPMIGRIYLPVAKAINLAGRAKLRALDLLHLSYAKSIKKVTTLVTLDENFEKLSEVSDLGLKVEIIRK